MSHDHRPLDEGVRKAAVTTSSHAFVWAGAGTGKTHTLTLRALYLILNGPFLQVIRETGTPLKSLYVGEDRNERLGSARFLLRSVVLTTFTRKAAAEMLSRLFSHLDTLARTDDLNELRREFSEEEGQPRDPLFFEIVEDLLNRIAGLLHQGADPYPCLRQGAQALAELSAELQVSTLHSFCTELLRRHPLEAGIPPGARFAREDESALEDVSDLLLEHWWNRMVPATPRLQELLGSMLAAVPLEDLDEWQRLILDHGWIVEELPRLSVLDEEALEQALGACRELALGLQKSGTAKMKEEGVELERSLRRIEAKEPGAWRDLLSLLVEKRTRFVHSSERPNRTKRIAEIVSSLSPDSALCWQAFERVYVPLLAAALNRELPIPWKAWLDYLRHFRQWSETACVDVLGLVTFDDMVRRAARLLEEHPPIRRRERRRLQAVLVDEFQDTDPEQLNLLKALLRKEEGEREEVLGFFVGDRKQSIYRFRRADLPILEKFCREYRALTRCRDRLEEFQLQTSFRSRPSLLDFVNRFFRDILPLTRPEEELLPFRPGSGPLPRWTSVESPEGDSLSADQRREAAAVETVRLIREYLDDPSAGDRSYRDVLVLVQKHREIDVLLPLLQGTAIPAVSVGARTFYRHPEVLDTLNLLIALHNPQDTLAVAAVLRSPMVQLSDVEIDRLMRDFPGPAVQGLAQPAGAYRLLVHSDHPLPHYLPEVACARLQALRKLARLRHSAPLRDWLREVHALIPIAAYTQAADREGRPGVRIRNVLESLRNQTEEGVHPPLVWLLRQRERASRGDSWDADLGEDVSVADEQVDAVRILTVHRAKGLEGKCVILFGWEGILTPHRTSRGPKVYSVTRQDGRRLRGFSLRWGPVTLESPDYDEAVAEDAHLEEAERVRLAYVATTRARERLEILLPGGNRGRFFPGIERLIEEGRESRDSPICGGTLEFGVRPPGDEPTATEETSRLQFGPQYRRLWEERYRLSVTPENGSLLSPSDPEHPDEEGLFESEDYKPPPGPGRATGRVVHAYLERFLESDTLQKEKLLLLVKRHAEVDRQVEVRRRAGRILERYFRGESVDEAGVPLIERVGKARVLGREVPVYLSTREGAWHGVVDLVLEEDDSVTAVDFKTTAPPAEIPPAYRNQERIYGEAVTRIFSGRRVRFEFWWLG